MAYKRLHKELKELTEHPIPFGSVEPTENPLIWKAFLNGPEGSPYEGGTFELEITFSLEYPMRSPQFQFKTHIFHANVDENGHVCVSLLGDWRPTDNMTTALIALYDLLAKPNRDSPLRGKGLTDSDYHEEARRHTKSYAIKP